MGHMEPIDPAWTLNRKAQSEGWPYHCDTALEFDRGELNEMRDVWRGLAAGKRAPSRTDFDARTLKPFLRNISILERVPVDHAVWRYRTRLSGSAIVEVAGEHTGAYLDEHIPPEFLPAWTSAYDTVLDSATPMRFVSDFRIPKLAYLSGESLLAPLADGHGGLTLVISCLYFRPKRRQADT